LRARSSRPTGAGYGWKIDPRAARCFVSPCRWPPIIHIVDDDASFRTAIGDLLSACGYRVALYESAKQLLKTPLSGEPACILLDVQMAGLSGPQLQDRLAELGCGLPIVFVTGHGDIPTSVRTIKAGAEDFLTKPVPKDRLLEAIKRAFARYEEMREQDGRIATLRSLLSRLTPREHEVLELLVRGNPHKQIAHVLGTSERTVKMHRHNVMQKFQVHSLAELAVIAERLGLLAAPGGSGNDTTSIAA
jgi:RNA polymerase sigma factor (sigma-70 family)